MTEVDLKRHREVRRRKEEPASRRPEPRSKSHCSCFSVPSERAKVRVRGQPAEEVRFPDGEERVPGFSVAPDRPL